MSPTNVGHPPTPPPHILVLTIDRVPSLAIVTTPFSSAPSFPDASDAPPFKIYISRRIFLKYCKRSVDWVDGKCLKTDMVSDKQWELTAGDGSCFSRHLNRTH